MPAISSEFWSNYITHLLTYILIKGVISLIRICAYVVKIQLEWINFLIIVLHHVYVQQLKRTESPQSLKVMCIFLLSFRSKFN